MLKVEFIGNLGANAEVKESNGSKFITMRAAHTTKYSKEDGTKVEETNWVDITYNDPESKVLPYLKAGVKIFVRGDLRLRVYSSKKDRCMKAGATISAREIELIGGSNDLVPRELINPESGSILKVSKYYSVEGDYSKLKKDECEYLIDRQANRFMVVKGGWVAPVPMDNPGETDQQISEDQQTE